MGIPANGKRSRNPLLRNVNDDPLVVKAHLQNRFGASVAEVDHHELWQRARITLSCSARDYKGAAALLAAAERYLHGQEFDCVSVERRVVSLDE